MEEFTDICHRATCNVLTLMQGFWYGLEEEIRFLVPSEDRCWSLPEYINFALWVDGWFFEL